MAKHCSGDCPFFEQRKEVPYAGNDKGKVVLLCDSPGAAEIKSQESFSRDSAFGKKTRELIEKAGLNWKNLRLLNAVKCPINKDKMPTKKITACLKVCRLNLAAELKRLQPKVIIVAGDLAAKQVLRKSGMKKIRGTWSYSEEFGCWVMPTFSPGYVSRQAAQAKLVIGDLKLVSGFVKNGYKLPEGTENVIYRDLQSLAPILDRIKGPKIASTDTEAQGFDYMSENFVTISASFSFKKGTGFNLSFFEECSEEEAEHQITWDRAPEGSSVKEPTQVYYRPRPNFMENIRALRDFLKRKDIYIITHVGGFELHAFRWLFNYVGMPMPKIKRWILDTQATANLIDENIYQMADMTLLQRHFTDVVVDHKADFTARSLKEDMFNAHTNYHDEFVNYASGDSDITRQIGIGMMKFLRKDGNERLRNYLTKHTMPTMELLHMMEHNGVRVDLENLPIITADIEQLMQEHHDAAMSVVPADILTIPRHLNKLKLSRPDLVRDILFHDDGFCLAPVKYTKNQEPCTDKETRSMLWDRPLRRPARDFLTSFGSYKEMHTLWSRYLKGFAKAVKCDGRIHTNFSNSTAVTGRLATSSPNMQNNPKRSQAAHLIRRLLVATPGYKFLAADHGQSELRWAAHVSQDPNMIRVFREGKIDIHTNTAMQLCQVAWSTLTKDEISIYRRNAKAVNFGLLYMMSLYGFIKYAKLEYGIDLSETEGQAWIDAFFGPELYAEILTYHHDTIAFGREHGYVESCLGRRRRLPELISDNAGLRSSAERMAVNQPIQSPSSDTCLMAGNEMIRDKVIGYNNDTFRIVLFVHDELIFEAREDKVDEAAQAIKWYMENPPLKRDFDVDFSVPFKTDVKMGDNLADMVELEL